GWRVCEPFRLTAPMPSSSESAVASVVDQVSVDDEPVGIDAGVAENVAVGAGALTVTLAVLVIVPPLPVTVRVYVVVLVGETIFEPLIATAPTPLSMETEGALLVDHGSVAELS